MQPQRRHERDARPTTPGRGAPLRALWVVCAALVLAGRASGAPDANLALEKAGDSREIMGTFVNVLAFGHDKATAESAIEDAFREIESVNALMNAHDPESELSRLNARTGAGPVEVSPELFAVLERALEMSALTEGALDVTVGPLVEVWKAAAKLDAPPGEAAVAEALERVGWQEIVLDKTRRTVALPAGMRIDLGALAKGYAVDRGVDALRKRDIRSFLIEAGGDLYVSGPFPGPSARPWKVGIQSPFEPDPENLIGGLLLSDRAAATSGHYYRYSTIRGKRYSHIIDPHTGRPVEDAIASATVIAPTCLDADALATALSVLGVEYAQTLIDRVNKGRPDRPFAALVITGDAERHAFLMTDSLAQYQMRASDRPAVTWDGRTLAHAGLALAGVAGAIVHTVLVFRRLRGRLAESGRAARLAAIVVPYVLCAALVAIGLFGKLR